MGRATGARAQLLMMKESSYGVKPSGNFTRMPFISTDLGMEQGLIDDPVIGRGRDPRTPSRDVKNVTGNVTVPVDKQFFGIWLSMMFGAATSSDETTYKEHIWDTGAGADDMLSYAMEIGHPDVPAYFLELGNKGNTMQLSFARSGVAQAHQY